MLWVENDIEPVLETMPFYVIMKHWLHTHPTVPVTPSFPWIQLDPPAQTTQTAETTAHVLVIGGGVAGLSAAAALVKVRTDIPKH